MGGGGESGRPWSQPPAPPPLKPIGDIGFWAGSQGVWFPSRLHPQPSKVGSEKACGYYPETGRDQAFLLRVLRFSACEPNRGGGGEEEHPPPSPSTPTASCLLTPHISLSTFTLHLSGLAELRMAKHRGCFRQESHSASWSPRAEGFLLLPPPPPRGFPWRQDELRLQGVCLTRGQGRQGISPQRRKRKPGRGHQGLSGREGGGSQEGMLRKDLAVTPHVTLPPPILTSSSPLLSLGGKRTSEKQKVCLHRGVRASGNQLRGGTSFDPILPGVLLLCPRPMKDVAPAPPCGSQCFQFLSRPLESLGTEWRKDDL